MKVVLQDKNTYVLKANVGEEVIGELQDFCGQKQIEAAEFFAIGATKDLRLGWYDIDKQEYTWKEFEEKLEVLSLLGNVARNENEVIVHAHGTFSNQQMQVIGGHVARLVVGAACEIVLKKLDGRIEKAFDEETGLNLMM